MTETAPVPEGTTEITYTGIDGTEQSIPIRTIKGVTTARPRNAADAAILAGFGWPVEHKAARSAAANEADEATTPAKAEEG